MANFIKWLEEKKKGTKESLPPTITSSPTRGANQDQSGLNDKNDAADYTISDSLTIDNWELNSPAARVKAVKDLTSLGNRHGAVVMPHSKIKEETINELVAGVGDVRIKPVNMAQKTGGSKDVNAPSNVGVLQSASDKRVAELDKAAQKQKDQAEKDREKETQRREKEAAQRQKDSENKNKIDEARLQFGSGRRGRTKAAGSEDDPGSDNIINQLRKVISLRGQSPVRFVDGTSAKISPAMAHTLLAKYDNLRTTGEKHSMSRRLHASSSSMREVLMGKTEQKKPKISLAGKITGTQNADHSK
jgi:hypothetical protein